MSSRQKPTANIDGKYLNLSWKMFANIPNLIKYHFEAGNMNWQYIVFFSVVHVTAVMGLFRVKYCSFETIFFAQMLWSISGYGVTVGAHRLWAHRSYEAHFILRLWLMITNSIAYQGSIYSWAINHRLHHAYAETNADPHNSSRGFFYSHIGWLLLKKHPERLEAEKKLDASDLWDDPLVRIQHMCDPWYAFYIVFFFPGQIAYYCLGEDYWNSVLVAGSLRYCIVLHFTFLVNSAAHLWGDRPYDSNLVAAENPIVNILTQGEGWHNWHHKYPFDYAASEFGVSSQWNVSKLVIDTMAKLGLAWGRKRGTSAWAMSRERRDREKIAGDANDRNINGLPLPKKIL